MNAKHWIVSTLAIAGLTAGALALQQDKQAMPAAAKDDPMAAMEAMGSPGPMHEKLAHKVGKWTIEGKFEMPGMGPMTMAMRSEAKWIFDGRFVEETVTGDFMGQPFKGIGTTGYDNLRQKYVSTWMDNMSTGIYYNEGTFDPATKTFTFDGKGPDQSMTKIVSTRMTDTMSDADHGISRSYEIGADGKQTQTFELRYTRAK